MASDVRYAEVSKMLEQCGFIFDRTKGSHFVWYKPGVGSLSIPVHNGKVKPVYVRQIKKLCGD